MKYLIFAPWGLGDLILTIPTINTLCQKKNNQKNFFLSLVVKGDTEYNCAKKNLNKRVKIINLKSLLSRKNYLIKITFFFFVFFKFKFYNYDNIIIPGFLSKKTFKIFTLCKFFFNFSVHYKKSNKHRYHIFIDQIQDCFNLKIDNTFEISKLQKKTKNKKKILLFPGSNEESSWKRYNISKFVELERKLSELKYDTLFLLGGNEIELQEKIKSKFVISRNFKTLDKILSATKCIISSDTGIPHYASLMFNTDIVLICGPSNPNFSKPIFSKVSVIKTFQKLNCMPCINTKLWGNCDKNMKCLETIDQDEIIYKIINT
jgi:ADP-heptose:LPS heptosyltransferase